MRQLHLDQVVLTNGKSFKITVNCQIEPGVTVIAGANGAGKTTILRFLATLKSSQSGRASFGDTKYGRNNQELRQMLGYCPQNFAVGRRDKVCDILEYCAWLKRVPSSEITAEVTRVASEVGLESRIRHRYGQLSGGMQRRCGLAQALIAEPKLLLLDEPGTGLDPGNLAVIDAVLHRVSERCTVVITSHIAQHLQRKDWHQLALPHP